MIVYILAASMVCVVRSHLQDVMDTRIAQMAVMKYIVLVSY